jgi:hypothetical protein
MVCTTKGKILNITFFEMAKPQPLHQNDAYDRFLFHYINNSRKRAVHQSYKPKPPNKDVKAPPH